MSVEELEAVKRILRRVRQARKESERVLENRSRELFETNERLTALSQSLEAKVKSRTSELVFRNSLLAALLENINSGFLFESFDDGKTLMNDYLAWFFELNSASTSAIKSKSDFVRLVRDGFVRSSEFQDWTERLANDETRNVSKDWELIGGKWVRQYYIPLQLEGMFLGQFWMYSDLTDEKELQEARLKAEEATKAKSAFLANISHELRNPLNGVIGMNRLLLDEKLTSRQRQQVEAVEDSARLLLRIIDDILDLSKMEALKVELESNEFSLVETLDGVVTICQTSVLEKGLALNVVYDPLTPDRLIGDPDRLQQILLNLVNNAINFTKEGGVCLTVKCARDESEERIRVTFAVEDTGIGFDVSNLDSFFQPFVQAEETVSGSYGGTGLGLAISRELMDLMGGRIEAESEKGKGSVFTFEVQFGVAKVLQSPFFAVKRDYPCLITSRSGPLKQSIQSILGCEGIASDFVNGLEQGLSMFDRFSIQQNWAWIVDVDTMDSRDIDELVNVCRGNPASVNLLCISTEYQRVETIEDGNVGVLKAPFTKRAFLKELDRLMGSEPGEKETSSATGFVGKAPLASMRILLVEDNLTNRQVGAMTLESVGAHVDLALDGFEAVRMLQRLPYELVLMDINMPRMSGLEACKRIREMGLSVPIFALTANAIKGDRERFLDSGMDGYLSKPLIRDELVASLKDLVSVKPIEAGPSDDKENGGDEVPILDVDSLGEIVGGNFNVIWNVLEQFDSQFKELLDNGKKAIHANDWKGAASLFHRLAGSSYSVHANRFAKSVIDMENLLKKETKEIGKINTLLKKVNTEGDLLAERIREIGR